MVCVTQHETDSKTNNTSLLFKTKKKRSQKIGESKNENGKKRRERTELKCLNGNTNKSVEVF